MALIEAMQEPPADTEERQTTMQVRVLPACRTPATEGETQALDAADTEQRNLETTMKHFALNPLCRDHLALQTAREFVDEQADALLNASELLGGGQAACRTLQLIDALAGANRMSRGIRRQLSDLLALLSLDSVDDLESIEAGLFAQIDPASPVVNDICRLTDSLADLIETIDEIEAEDRRNAVPAFLRSSAA